MEVEWIRADGNLVCFLFCCSTLGIFMVLWACGELAENPQSMSAYIRLSVGLCLFGVIVYRFRRFQRAVIQQFEEEERQREALGMILLIDRLAPVVGVPCQQTVGQAVPADGVPVVGGPVHQPTRAPAELPDPLPARRPPSLFSEPRNQQFLRPSTATPPSSPPDAAIPGEGRVRAEVGGTHQPPPLVRPRRGSRSSLLEVERLRTPESDASQPRGRRRARTFSHDA
eukprot:Hpha_TRINITY_DN12042_c0_g2::TRINITY_DN12042_c0_g2_i1::g.141233::m.141233